MQLKQTLIIALALSIISITTWEFFLRSEGVITSLDDNEALWAMQRGRVETATSTEVLLMGSSRVLFDIQLNAVHVFVVQDQSCLYLNHKSLQTD